MKILQLLLCKLIWLAELMVPKAALMHPKKLKKVVEEEASELVAEFVIDDTTCDFGKAPSMSWGEIYNTIHQEMVEAGNPDVQVYHNIRKSGVYRFGCRPAIAPCAEVVHWIIQRTDPETGVISNTQGEMICKIGAERIHAIYRMPEPQTVIDDDWLRRIDQDPDLTVKEWWTNPKGFRTRKSGYYPTMMLREPFKLLAAIFNKLNEEPDCEFVKTIWVPIMNVIINTGSTINFDLLITHKLLAIISDCKKKIEAGIPYQFHMQAYLLDIVISVMKVPVMGWDWSAQQKPIHYLCENMWRSRCRTHMSAISNHVIIPIYQNLHCDVAPCLSEEAQKTIKSIGDWFLRPNAVYIRVSGTKAHPRLLPWYVLDKVVLAETADQMEYGMSAELNRNKKATWPAFPISVGAYCMRDWTELASLSKWITGISFRKTHARHYDPRNLLANHCRRLAWSYTYRHVEDEKEDECKNLLILDVANFRTGIEQTGIVEETPGSTSHTDVPPFTESVTEAAKLAQAQKRREQEEDKKKQEEEARIKAKEAKKAKEDKKKRKEEQQKKKAESAKKKAEEEERRKKMEDEQKEAHEKELRDENIRKRKQKDKEITDKAINKHLDIIGTPIPRSGLLDLDHFRYDKKTKTLSRIIQPGDTTAQPLSSCHTASAPMLTVDLMLKTGEATTDNLKDALLQVQKLERENARLTKEKEEDKAEILKLKGKSDGKGVSELKSYAKDIHFEMEKQVRIIYPLGVEFQRLTNLIMTDSAKAKEHHEDFQRLRATYDLVLNKERQYTGAPLDIPRFSKDERRQFNFVINDFSKRADSLGKELDAQISSHLPRFELFEEKVQTARLPSLGKYGEKCEHEEMMRKVEESLKRKVQEIDALGKVTKANLKKFISIPQDFTAACNTSEEKLRSTIIDIEESESKAVAIIHGLSFLDAEQILRHKESWERYEELLEKSKNTPTQPSLPSDPPQSSAAEPSRTKEIEIEEILDSPVDLGDDMD